MCQVAVLQKHVVEPLLTQDRLWLTTVSWRQRNITTATISHMPSTTYPILLLATRKVPLRDAVVPTTDVKQEEVERLNIFHDVLTRVFDGRLIFPPIQRPRRILDCGYGTGAWASEVAEQNPRCEVRSRLLAGCLAGNSGENPKTSQFISTLLKMPANA